MPNRAIPGPPLITLGGLAKSPTNGSDGELAGCRRVRRRSERSRSPKCSSNSCLPQPYHATMLEPRASVGSQASQPHLEDGTAYRPLRTHVRPIVRLPLGGGVVRLHYVPSQRLKTSLQGIYKCKCTWSHTESPRGSDCRR